MLILSFELFIVVLLFLSLWIYQYAKPLLILVDIHLSIVWIYFYIHVKESLCRFLRKYFDENPQNLRLILHNEDHRLYMLERKYPFDDLILCKRTEILDYYTTYWYLLEGGGKVWWCKTRKFKDFKEAFSFQRNNTVVLGIYMFSIPIVAMIEYIIEKTESMKVGNFSFLFITSLYIFAITITAVIYINSFARSFDKILPFMKFKQQLMSISLCQSFSSLVELIVKSSTSEFGPYSEFSSYILLYIWVYSGVFAIVMVMQNIVLGKKINYKQIISKTVFMINIKHFLTIHIFIRKMINLKFWFRCPKHERAGAGENENS